MPIPPTATGENGSGWGFGAVLAGFRYLAGNQVVLMSFVVDLIAMIFGMPRALFPQMAHESFGGPVAGGTTMALLAAAMSVGAVASGMAAGVAGGPRIADTAHGAAAAAVGTSSRLPAGECWS